MPTVHVHSLHTALSEFGLVGGLPSLGAFWLICRSGFHDDAHDAFMTLPPYTRTREGKAPPGSWPATLLVGPLSEETLSTCP